ncbi:hypothetical protein RRG08_058704 [Elysia crispata]|uniref:Uncharacterized protein n=1 Tax=Elysia crispata TaxID=231223 RepID=A0AAE0YW79_9GAST|nr:hypothetical protein RRG08_058704 [Elysia crispata]
MGVRQGARLVWRKLKEVKINSIALHSHFGLARGALHSAKRLITDTECRKTRPAVQTLPQLCLPRETEKLFFLPGLELVKHLVFLKIALEILLKFPKDSGKTMRKLGYFRWRKAACKISQMISFWVLRQWSKLSVSVVEQTVSVSSGANCQCQKWSKLSVVEQTVSVSSRANCQCQKWSKLSVCIQSFRVPSPVISFRALHLSLSQHPTYHMSEPDPATAVRAPRGYHNLSKWFRLESAVPSLNVSERLPGLTDIRCEAGEQTNTASSFGDSVEPKKFGGEGKWALGTE